MTAAATRLQAMALIGRGVFIELKRRKDFYVIAILMALFLISVFLVNIVGVDNASTATFLLNLGMTLAYYLAHALTLILTARQVPDEIEKRTLYPLLARPIDRTTYLLGKYASCAICGFAVFLLLGAMGWFPVPKVEYYSFSLLLQLIVLQAVSLSMIASLSLFFSILAPRGIGIVAIGLLFAFGNQIITFGRARLENGAAEPVGDWLLGYVPNFQKLNLITRYTDGIEPLALGPFVSAVLYGALMSAAFLALSIFLFHRRPL